MRLPTQFKPTTVEDWTRSDLYHNTFLIPHDEANEVAKRNSDANDLPEIAVSAAQGKFLSLLARSVGAKRILEVGTLGGYVKLFVPLPSYIDLHSVGSLLSGLRRPFPRMGS